MDYSPKITSLKCFTPALIQSLASPLMVARRMVVGAEVFQKTLTLRSLQIAQLASIVKGSHGLANGRR
jgi:hypothetical protein